MFGGMMKSIRILTLTGLLALALAGCLGPPPTVAPNATPTNSGPKVTAATVVSNTPRPAGYPAPASPTQPATATLGPYPAAGSPTAATIQGTATAVPSDTEIPDTP